MGTEILPSQAVTPQDLEHKPTNFKDVFWRSLTEAGFVAGLLGLLPLQMGLLESAMFFGGTLALLTLSIANFRLFQANQGLRERTKADLEKLVRQNSTLIQYFATAQETFDSAADFVENAEQNIHVTWFSDKTVGVKSRLVEILFRKRLLVEYFLLAMDRDLKRLPQLGQGLVARDPAHPLLDLQQSQRYPTVTLIRTLPVLHTTEILAQSAVEILYGIGRLEALA